MSYVEWDPAFEFKKVAFAALWDLTADPDQELNRWMELSAAERAVWHEELEAEFSCAGHHGLSTDCS